MRWRLPLLSCVVLAACSPTASPTGGSNPVRCDRADVVRAGVRVWVDNAASLNGPDTDLIDTFVVQESVQRRIFELCSLAEAEKLNREIPFQVAPGIVEPMIEPDFETFAEIECVDESPLLDGTTTLCRGGPVARRAATDSVVLACVTTDTVSGQPCRGDPRIGADPVRIRWEPRSFVGGMCHR